MKRIQLWLVSKDGAAGSAVPVDEVMNTETEQLLEDMLVASPELLEPGLKLIGRQMPTDGGPMDLLGVDQDGRLTVFELKRGILTRDAVAQSLDYASDLEAYEFERLATLVQEYSGRLGIDKIEDFEDWYSQEYPGSSDALAEAPRIVLVGLGVDDRARRIVQFLAERGTEIQLLTFYGFRQDDQLFLARESVTPNVIREHGTAATKERNLEALRGRAKELGLLDLLERVRTFVEKGLDAYCWPGKTAYSFSLQALTDEGRPTSRSYATLYVLQAPMPGLSLCFYSRATEAAGAETTAAFIDAAGGAASKSKSYALEVRVTEPKWETLQQHLTPFLDAMVSGWRVNMSAETGDNSSSAPEQ